MPFPQKEGSIFYICSVKSFFLETRRLRVKYIDFAEMKMKFLSPLSINQDQGYLSAVRSMKGILRQKIGLANGKNSIPKFHIFRCIHTYGLQSNLLALRFTKLYQLRIFGFITTIMTRSINARF